MAISGKGVLKNTGISVGSILAYVLSMWGIDKVNWSEMAAASHSHTDTVEMVRTIIEERTIQTCP